MSQFIGNTPLVHLDFLSASKSIKVYAKLEYENMPTHSVKDRIVNFIMAEEIERGNINSDTTLVEASSGNTATALAAYASMNNHKCILFVPEKTSKEKLSDIMSYGANITVNIVPKEQDYLEVARNFSKTIKNIYLMNQYDNPQNIQAHYEGLGPEIWRDMDGSIDYFITTASTGGTISGVAKFLKEQDPNIKIILADPVGSVLKAYYHGQSNYLSTASSYKIEGAGKDSVSSNFNVLYIDDAKDYTDKDAIKMVDLLQSRGFNAGGSAGGNAYIAQRIASELLYSSRIVTIFPDGGEKYSSKFSDSAWRKSIGL